MQSSEVAAAQAYCSQLAARTQDVDDRDQFDHVLAAIANPHRIDQIDELTLAELRVAAAPAAATLAPVVYNLPSVRLPRLHKVAFNSSELFSQQRDHSRFDYGLQLILDALHDGIVAVTGHDVSLSAFIFVMNFVGAVSPNTPRRFAVQMHFPVAGPAELTQTVGDDMSLRWSLQFNGIVHAFRGASLRDAMFNSGPFVSPPVPAAPMPLSAPAALPAPTVAPQPTATTNAAPRPGREDRVIDFD